MSCDSKRISILLRELVSLLSPIGPEFGMSELEFDDETDEVLAEWVFDIKRYEV